MPEKFSPKQFDSFEKLPEDQNPNFKPVDVPVGSQGARHKHLEEIQPVTENNYHSHEGQGKIIPLARCRHQDQNGHSKIDNQIGIKYDAVRTMLTQLKVCRLIRNVGIPNQHVLREPKVGPENTECKHELTQIMQVLLCNQLQITLILQIDYPKQNQRPTTYESASKRVPREHR